MQVMCGVQPQCGIFLQKQVFFKYDKFFLTTYIFQNNTLINPHPIPMKVHRPFFLSIFSFSSNFFPTMNLFHYSRRLAQGVLVMSLLLVAQFASAQCGDFQTEPGSPPYTTPVNITINLTNGGGAPLDNAVLSSYGFNILTGSGCFYEVAESGDPSFTAPFSLPYTFFCGEVATSPNTLYLRVNGGGGPSSPANVRELHITIIDGVTPTVDFVPVVLEPVDPGECYWEANLGIADAVVSDNCFVDFVTYVLTLPDASTVTLFNTLDGYPFPVGQTNIEVFATDFSDNVSLSDFYNVDVFDNEAPVNACPVYPAGSPLVISADPGACDYTTDASVLAAFDITNGFTDNCGIISYEYRINLNGTQPPAQGPWTISPSGLMDGIVLPVNVDPVQLFHVIRYRATDDAGNTTTCTFHVRIDDTEDPEFDVTTIPSDVTLYTDDNVLTSLCYYDDFTFVTPDVADNCNNPITNYEFRVTGATTQGWTTSAAGISLTGDLNVGINTIEFRATDAAGNSAFASFVVTVEDNEAPVVTPAPADQNYTFSVSGTDCSKVVTFTRPSFGAVADCSTPVTMTETVVSGSDLDVLDAVQPFVPGSTVTVQFPSGETVIEYCWNDNAGNSTCIAYTFFIDENVAPTALCQNRTVQLNASGVATLLASAANNGSSDNCPVGLVTSISASAAGSANPNGVDWDFDCTDLGTHNYTLTATDAAGNTSTANCTVTVLDNVAPVVLCPAAVVQAAGATCIGNIGTLGNLAFDANGTLVPGEYDNNCENNNITIAVSSVPAVAGLPAPVTSVQPTVSLSSVNFPVGTTTVVYNLTDAAGNIAACNFTVTIADQTAPVATNCPPNITVNANIAPGCSYKRPNSAPGGCIIDVNNPANQWCGTVNFTDNCGGTSSVSNPASLTQTYPLGPNTITLTRTDAAGNVGTCSFTITVVDQTAPTAICQSITRSLSSTPVNGGTVTVSAENDLDNGSFDNCYLDLIYEVKKGLPASANPYGTSVTFGCGETGPQTVTFRVSEDGGTKSSTQTCTVTIQDVTAPTVTCPATFTVNLLATGLNTVTAASIGATATDNCAAPTLVGIRRGNSATPTASIGVNCADAAAAPFLAQVVYQDASGLQGTCNINVDVNDITPPNFSISNSGSIAVCAAPFVTPAPVPVYSDACGVNAGSFAQVGSTITNPGSCPGNYTLISTYVVADVNGNTSTAIFIVNVQDNVAPTITLPANATINLSATPGNCTPSATYSATFSDNCTPAPTGPTSTLNANATWVVRNQANAIIASGTNKDATANFPTGANTITFTTTDQCGNTATKSMTITVVDNVAPSFSNSYINTYCPTANTVFPYNNTPGTCGYTFVWNRPYAGTNITDCAWTPTVPANVNVTETIVNNGNTIVPSQSYVANSPTLFPAIVGLPVGNNLFTYTANDGFGNTATCSFTVRVIDNQGPTLAGMQMTTLTSICPTQTIPDYRGLVQVTDNCPSNVTLTQEIISPNALAWTMGGVTLAQVFSPAAPADNATFVVQITANDGFNPVVTRNITVTLEDNVAPVFTTASLSPAESECGYIILEAPTATTNDCGPNSGATVYGTPGGVPAAGEDILTGSNPIVYTSYRITLAAGITSCQPYVITWSYNDGNGNVSTQFQSLQLCPDTTAPTAVCVASPINVVLNPTTAMLTVAQVDNNSFDTDDCNPFTLAISKGPGGPFASSLQFTCAEVSPNNTGSTTVVLRATDNANPTQSSTCSVQVKVLDNIAPVINDATVPNDTTLYICAPTDQAAIPAAATTVTASDNCSATVSFAQVSTQGTSGVAKYNYTITRTWTAVDVFGNTDVETQVLTVRDTVKPTFTPPTTLTFNTALNATNCSGNVTFNLAAFVADCAPDAELNLVVTPNYFSLTDNTQTLPVGSHTVTFVATDPAGNVANTSLTFVVNDATAPIASCINGISVTLNGVGEAVVTPNLINNQSADNCTLSGALTLLVQELDGPNGDTLGSPTPQLTFGCGEADGDTEYPIILVVRDAAGNTSTCETYVIIQDNVAPVITCPASISIDCSSNLDPSLPANGIATATDNCGPDFIDLTYTDAPQYDGYSCGNVVRTWLAVDQAQNSATCVQNFTITDTKPPIFLTAPPSDTVSCDNPLAATPILTASDVDDDCTPSDSISIVLNEVSTQDTIGCNQYNFTTTRTWTITDKCGNSATHVQVVKVEDLTGPQFLGMPDTIFVESASLPATTNCTVPVVFNAGAPSIFSDCAPLAECTVNSVSFFPTLVNPITPNVLDVSGNYPVGTTRVIFNVTDPCGNVGIDTLYISVKDNTTPTAVCKNNVVVSLGNTGQGTITAADINLNSNDNCGIASMVLSQTAFDCQDLGTQQVTLTVTDIYGNTNACTVAVEVAAGNGTGFTSTVTSVATAYFGATDGVATVTATGGSGNFTYAWSSTPAQTTATAINLPAGAYSVTITDAFTGCQQVATVTVPEGPKVKFTVGNVTGTSGSIVKIPVFAEHFYNLSGFSFTLNLSNTAIGSIVTPVAVTDVNAALTGLSATPAGPAVAVFWTESSGNDVTIGNGASTLLFNLCVQLSNAPLGTSSDVIVDGLPPDPDPIALRDGGVVVLPADAMNGSVQITLGLNDYDIAGDIRIWTPSAAGIANVTVDLMGTTPAQNFLTVANGQYGFNNIPATTNTLTTPNKVTQGPSFNAGISVADHILLKQHLGAIAPLTTPFTSPYQFVAADVNLSGTINIVDLNLIQRVTADNKRLSQITPTAPKDWVFVPASYTFPAFGSSIPFANVPAYPQTIAHNPIFQDELNDDFIGVRLGDLNGNTPLNLTNEEVDDRSGDNLIFEAQDRQIEAGEVFEVAFKANNFTDRFGYQFTLGFDPNVLAVEDITTGNLAGLNPTDNFGTLYLSEGSLTTVWSSAHPVSLAANEAIFTVKFKALHSTPLLSNSLTINSDVTEALSVDGFMSETNVELAFTPAATSGTGDVVAEKAILYQNQPNPFIDETIIGFRLASNERATLRIYSANGRLVRTVIGDFAKGYNTIQIRPSDLGAKGVYYYELATPTFSDRKKMILID
jgi:hypothetical protein